MNYNMSDDKILHALNEKIRQISNTISDFDPTFLFNSLFNRMDIKSVPITMEVISNNGTKNSIEMNLVPLLDITGDTSKEKEAFSNNMSRNYIIPKDMFSQMYFTSLGVLGIYILFNIMKKSKMIPI
jgi:hypothetical protein